MGTRRCSLSLPKCPLQICLHIRIGALTSVSRNVREQGQTRQHLNTWITALIGISHSVVVIVNSVVSPHVFNDSRIDWLIPQKYSIS